MKYLGKRAKSGNPDRLLPTFVFTNEELEILQKVLGPNRKLLRNILGGSDKDYLRIKNVQNTISRYLILNERKQNEK